MSNINPELLKSKGKASEKKGTENCSRVNNPDNASGDHGGTQRPGSEKSGELHSSPGPFRMTSPPSVLTGRKNKAPRSGAGLAFDRRLDENDQEEDHISVNASGDSNYDDQSNTTGTDSSGHVTSSNFKRRREADLNSILRKDSPATKKKRKNSKTHSCSHATESRG